MSDSQLALAGMIAVFLLMSIGFIAGYLQLKQIHSAVNSNMTAALNKISELHERVAALVEERGEDKKKGKEK